MAKSRGTEFHTGAELLSRVHFYLQNWRKKWLSAAQMRSKRLVHHTNQYKGISTVLCININFQEQMYLQKEKEESVLSFDILSQTTFLLKN